MAVFSHSAHQSETNSSNTSAKQQSNSELDIMINSSCVKQAKSPLLTIYAIPVTLRRFLRKGKENFRNSISIFGFALYQENQLDSF